MTFEAHPQILKLSDVHACLLPCCSTDSSDDEEGTGAAPTVSEKDKTALEVGTVQCVLHHANCGSYACLDKPLELFFLYCLVHCVAELPLQYATRLVRMLRVRQPFNRH